MKNNNENGLDNEIVIMKTMKSMKPNNNDDQRRNGINEDQPMTMTLVMTMKTMT